MSDLADIFGSEFTGDEYEPMRDFTVLPPGKYPVEVENASVNQTKAGTGHYIKLELRVIDGEYKGAPLFDNINIDNPSAKAVEIGKRVLTAIKEALNVGPLKSTAQLIGGKMLAHVKVKNEQNDIRTYSALTKDSVVNSQSPPKTNQSQPEGKLPWMR